jgi:hypothetical protein
MYPPWYDQGAAEAVEATESETPVSTSAATRAFTNFVDMICFLGFDITSDADGQGNTPMTAPHH